MRRIFHHKATGRSHLLDKRGKLRRDETAKVNDDRAARFVSYTRPRVLKIHREVARRDLSEDRSCADERNDHARGDERLDRHEHFIAWSNSKCEQRCFHRRGAARKRDAVRLSAVRRKVFFKLRNAWTHREHAVEYLAQLTR